MTKLIGLLLLLVILAACASSPSSGELDLSGVMIIGELRQSGTAISLADAVAVDGTNRYIFEYCCSPESSLIVSHSGVDLAMTVMQPSGASTVTNALYTQSGPLPEGTWAVVVKNVGKETQDYVLAVSLE